MKSQRNAKIIIKEFYTKIGRKGVLQPNLGRMSLYENAMKMRPYGKVWGKRRKKSIHKLKKE